MKFNSYNEIRFSYAQMKLTYLKIIQERLQYINLFEQFEDVVFVGCGSSYWLSLSAYQTFSNKTNKRCFAVKATDIVMSAENYKKKYTNPIFITPSRSGESKELLDSILIMKKYYPNSKILSITEFENNSLSKLSDVNISIPWANEVSVCQTRSFNSLYISILTIIGVISNADLLENIDVYLDHAEELYEIADLKVRQIVDTMIDPEIVTLGSGVQYGVVIEGAYIVLEMAQKIASYFQTLEYRHGPVVTANNKTYAFICSLNATNEKYEIDMAKEIKNTNAKIVMIGKDTEFSDFDFNLTISNKYCEEIRGLYFVTIMQLTAHYLAIKNGKNPDIPGNLVKFISYK